ncbi:hypothetical protein EVAR_35226_1 [Eumeta japonica]|uniref:Uncharacterized protein n=1 Tax=Eumeta variegata TaxID=151549 RepID=A0A4C1VEF7_EUMVA|nr:hypothetical protein EVAR_35226_1 [Eumeta japonica]
MTHCRVPSEPSESGTIEGTIGLSARLVTHLSLFHSIGRCVRAEERQRPHTTTLVASCRDQRGTKTGRFDQLSTKIIIEYRREAAASAVAFCPVSESSGVSVPFQTLVRFNHSTPPPLDILFLTKTPITISNSSGVVNVHRRR